jgi:hypothetical protein
MIAGGWSYITAAYIVALGALTVLAVIVTLRQAYWAKRAAELEKRK